MASQSDNSKHFTTDFEEGTASTPIQEFYKNQTIFITGGTGFIGKVLIEKLSRSCSGISRIYLIVRKKKGKELNERMQHFFDDAIFDNVRSEVPNFAEKIVGIAGDCSQENIGLSDDDILLLQREVSIIFHCAATVRFDERLKNAVTINIQSTITITDMCRKMKNLKALIYVSTAYAHCLNNSTIEEKFYDYPIAHEDLLTLIKLPEKVVDKITPSLLDKSWINTYTCTKAMTENYLETKCHDLPVGIHRPAIVTPTAFEPIIGWANNYYGITGVFAGVSSGIMRTLHCDPKKLANLIPADLTVNSIIASAWDVARQEIRRGTNMPIYNFTDPSESPITWDRICNLGLKYDQIYPLKTALWCASLQLTRHDFVFKLQHLVLHTFPAFLVDLLARIIGRKPQMMKIYDRVFKMNVLMKPVITNGWKISNEEVQSLWNKMDARDKKIFKFRMHGFDWDKYICNVIKGIRVHIFKDDMKTLADSRSRYKKLYLLNFMLRIALIVLAHYAYKKISLRLRCKPAYKNHHIYT